MGLFKRQLQTGGLCRLDNCNNSERSSRRFIKTTMSSSPVEEATYQLFDQRTVSTVLGHQELNSAHFWVSVLTECLSCYIYVFIVCSTRISWTGSVIGHEPNLLAMALSSGIAMMLLILTFRTVHVNPALTIAFLLTGRVPLVRAILYILVHCMGSLAAVTSLYSISVKGHAGALGLDNPHDSLNSWQIMIVEMVISFVVTLTTFATCNYSSYTSARQFILEQAIGRNSSLLFSDLFPASPTCDNIAVISNNGPSTIGPQSSRPVNSSTAPLSRPARPNGNFRVHPQQTKSTNGGFLTEIYANEELNSDYDLEFEGNRMYANSQQQQQQSSNSDSSPIGNKVPPIEELMQNESQLLASNGFSLHVTVGQALVIGLAYTLTSLSGIPASGASLNPARSFGPAFIMNRWDQHWIYWLGPIAGAAIAGFFYEYIFNPTKKSSLCYLPKLFRLSAHDMAKVCSKSRLFHQHQHHHHQQSQRLSPFNTTGNLYPTAPGVYHPQTHLHQQMPLTIQHSPNSRITQGGDNLGNFMSNATLVNHQHAAMPASISLARLQTSHQFGGGDNINHNHHSQQPIHDVNYDRSKSTAIINLIATKQQQSTINLPQQGSNNANFHSASSSNGSSSHVSSSNQNQQLDFGKFSTSLFPRGFKQEQQTHQRHRAMNQQHSLAAAFETSTKPAFSEL